MSARWVRRALTAFAYLPFTWVQGFGAALGFLSNLFPNAQRAVARRNLELAFPELSVRERKALARRSLIESGKTLTETIAIWLGPQGRVAPLIKEVKGEEAFREAVAAGRGVILCSPHLGSWEIAGLYFGAHYHITTMYRPPHQKALEEVVRNARERTGAHLVPTDASGIRALYQALKENGVVGILPDQAPPNSQGTFAPFFGIQATTMTLVTRLAAKTGAPVFFTFAERLTGTTGFRLHIFPAPAGVADSDPVRAATALNAGVEECVRMAPSQYQWSYKRFRFRPEGEPLLY